jgi:hypothetical protein
MAFHCADACCPGIRGILAWLIYPYLPRSQRLPARSASRLTVKDTLPRIKLLTWKTRINLLEIALVINFSSTIEQINTIPVPRPPVCMRRRDLTIPNHDIDLALHIAA